MPTNNRRSGSSYKDSEQLFQEFFETRDTNLRQRLIDDNQKLVRYLASKFANRGEPLEDLIAVGNIGLVKAVDRYDPTRGAKFCTFATPTIVGEIRRYFRDKSWGLKVPRRLQELNHAASKASEKLYQQLGKPPSVADIAKEIGCTEEEALEALEVANAYEAVSVDSPAGDGDGSGFRPEDALGADDEMLQKLELYDDLARALDSLGERERNVLYYRFFNDMSQTEVANRLNISQMHVSRLQSKALRRLKQLLSQ